jgi:hypothetical protein
MTMIYDTAVNPPGLQIIVFSSVSVPVSFSPGAVHFTRLSAKPGRGIECGKTIAQDRGEEEKIAGALGRLFAANSMAPRSGRISARSALRLRQNRQSGTKFVPDVPLADWSWVE